MRCENVQGLISLLLDRRLAGEERDRVLEHLGSCRICTAHLDSAKQLRAAMLQMNRARVPDALHANLRVLASHEQQRRLLRADPWKYFGDWVSRVRLAFDNLMRPFAVPVAGGSFSALVLFCMLVPNLSFPHNFSDQSLLTDPYGAVVLWSGNGALTPSDSDNSPRIQPVYQASPDDANVVELTIDEVGRVSDYTLTQGKLTKDLRDIIMFSQFRPATLLGLPTQGKVKAVQFNLGRGLRS
jgi:hypothetical protein